MMCEHSHECGMLLLRIDCATVQSMLSTWFHLRGSLLAERETGWSRLVPEAVREEACLGPRWPGVGRLEGLSAILSKWLASTPVAKPEVHVERVVTLVKKSL
jgi:hypothetical protein